VRRAPLLAGSNLRTVTPIALTDATPSPPTLTPVAAAPSASAGHHPLEPLARVAEGQRVTEDASAPPPPPPLGHCASEPGPRRDGADGGGAMAACREAAAGLQATGGLELEGRGLELEGRSLEGRGSPLPGPAAGVSRAPLEPASPTPHRGGVTRAHTIPLDSPGGGGGGAAPLAATLPPTREAMERGPRECRLPASAAGLSMAVDAAPLSSGAPRRAAPRRGGGAAA